MTPKEKAIELVNKYRTYVVMWAGFLFDKKLCPDFLGFILIGIFLVLLKAVRKYYLELVY